jgi:hypothetical protein
LLLLETTNDATMKLIVLQEFGKEYLMLIENRIMKNSNNDGMSVVYLIHLFLAAHTPPFDLATLWQPKEILNFHGMGISGSSIIMTNKKKQCHKMELQCLDAMPIGLRNGCFGPTQRPATKRMRYYL